MISLPKYRGFGRRRRLERRGRGAWTGDCSGEELEDELEDELEGGGMGLELESRVLEGPGEAGGIGPD